MSILNKKVITEKHIEAIVDITITLVFCFFGNFEGRINGKIVSRKRNRFKQYVFVPIFPFMTFAFASSDVQSIDICEEGVIVTVNQITEIPKRKRKKKKLVSVAISETTIDLNNVQSTVQVTPPIL